MFEIKVVKKITFSLEDFRGTQDQQELTESQLKEKLSELGATKADINYLVRNIRAHDRSTATIFISASRWSKIEESAKAE